MLQFPLGRTPVFIHLHEDLEIDGLAKKLLQRLAGLGRDLLQRHTLMTDDDTLLRVALHVDHGIDVDMLIILLETLHSDLYRIRNLLVVIEQDLLADNL